ncbi:phage tail tape measure protein, partial [Turicimonas muris]|uniref:phage tail tape measure protein n=1 Tax=Turicimonas muris TaxID=1796652 RepID=UPI0025B77D1D
KNVLSALKEYDSIMKSPLPKGANSLGNLLFTGSNDKSLPVIERTKNDIEEISKQLRDKGFSGVEVSEAPRRNRSDGTSQSYKVKYKDGDNYKEGIVSKSDYTSGSGSSMARYDMRETRVRDASPMKNWANQVKHKIQSLSAYYVSDYILDAGMQQLREGYQFVSDLDSALTNISMTMNTSSQSLSNLGKSAIQTGVDLSTNASNVLEAVTIYANANETTDSILEKATPTLMLANASGDSAANASNYLQAVVNQFDGMEGQEKRIVNSYEKISAGLAMDFSQGISGMAEAVTNAGSVASEAGFSFEEFSAIAGSIAEKTRQDFGSIGNTLKTTFARISRAKSADPDVTEKDRSQAALAYKEVAGIDLYDKKGQLKNMPDTLDEL